MLGCNRFGIVSLWFSCSRASWKKLLNMQLTCRFSGSTMGLSLCRKSCLMSWCTLYSLLNRLLISLCISDTLLKLKSILCCTLCRMTVCMSGSLRCKLCMLLRSASIQDRNSGMQSKMCIPCSPMNMQNSAQNRRWLSWRSQHCRLCIKCCPCMSCSWDYIEGTFLASSKIHLCMRYRHRSRPNWDSHQTWCTGLLWGRRNWLLHILSIRMQFHWFGSSITCIRRWQDLLREDTGGSFKTWSQRSNLRDRCRRCFKTCIYSWVCRVRIAGRWKKMKGRIFDCKSIPWWVAVWLLRSTKACKASWLVKQQNWWG